METQALAATRTSFFLPHSLALCQQVQDGRSVSIPSSLGRQWSFRVERRKLTLLSSKRKCLLDMRAMKSAAGSCKVKSKEPEAEEEDDQLAPGTGKLFKLPGTRNLPTKGGNRSRDNNTIFVAGATGKVGRRTVRELVRLGYKVRAGVRNPGNAQFLLEQEEKKEESDDEEAEEQPKKKNIFANFSINKLFGFLGPKTKRGAGQVELVLCDLEKSVDDIEEALGNAGVVVCAIGASEKEASDITGPYRIDYKATENLIDAASIADVNHFILVTSLGTQKFGWPAAVLNLFWGVLYWKAKAEKALVESGIPFTIVRPGGMARPTDVYKKTHNLRLAEADTLFGGQVSNLQVAELMAAVVGNLDLARNKILEAVAETTAPLRPFEDLLAEISSVDEESKPVKNRSEISREVRQTTKQQQEEERAAALRLQASEQEKTEARRQKLQEEYEAARIKQEEAKKEVEAARAQKAELERKTAELRSKFQAAEQFAREAKALETALIAAARQGKKLSDREKQDIIASVRAEVEAQQREAEAKQKAVQAAKERSMMVEAKANVPVKSKAEAAAEKQAKQEAEKKAKQEAEAKAAAESEVAAKASAEEEERKKIEAKRQAKEEEENKKKIEAERKAKEKEEEEEEKKKVEGERKTKEDEEKTRIVAERKAQAEEGEEMQTAAKVEAEAKPKGFRWPWQMEGPDEEAVPPSLSTIEKTATAEEPQTKELPPPSRPLSPYTQFPSLKPPTSPSPLTTREVQAAVDKAPMAVTKDPVLDKEEEKPPAVVAEASPEQVTKAAFGGFRWPWQKPESADELPQSETAPINPTTIQEEAITKKTELPRPARPLSPYTAYPTLKPPVPPSPPRTSMPRGGETEAKVETPKEPSAESALVVEVQAQEESQEEINARAEEEERLKALAVQEAEAVAERERLALEKAKGAIGFPWSWGKPDGVQPEVTAVPSAESTVSSPSAVAPEVANPAPTESSESTSTTEQPRPKSLSPYIMYPGLKPPLPPSPPKGSTKEEPAEPAWSVQPQSQDSGNGSATEKVEDGEKVLEPAGSFRWPWEQQ